MSAMVEHMKYSFFINTGLRGQAYPSMEDGPNLTYQREPNPLSVLSVEGKPMVCPVIGDLVDKQIWAHGGGWGVGTKMRNTPDKLCRAQILINVSQ
jgi:hypothetical protein